MATKTITLSLPDFHNWKTTTGGATGALGIILANKAAFLSPHPDLTHCAGVLIVAVSILAIGLLSHDAGTPSNSTLEVVADLLNSLAKPTAPSAVFDPTAPTIVQAVASTGAPSP